MEDVDKRVHIHKATALERMNNIVLFNNSHVLYLRSETIIVLRQTNIVLDDYDGQMILYLGTNVAQIS